MELTNEQKHDIVEYIFAFNTGTLIKPEALHLIDALLDMEAVSEGTASKWRKQVEDANPEIDEILMSAISQLLTTDEIDGLMQQYYKGEIG